MAPLASSPIGFSLSELAQFAALANAIDSLSAPAPVHPLPRRTAVVPAMVAGTGSKDAKVVISHYKVGTAHLFTSEAPANTVSFDSNGVNFRTDHSGHYETIRWEYIAKVEAKRQ
ncbi:hypothetical protein ACFV4G_39730 [Kitasatospora sp. NPDC059747]|uniref:hypothetical protein n=1 Tax=Kitasatospora sp. NPDC059747 TaxID=3346930 RepID=UPI003655444E